MEAEEPLTAAVDGRSTEFDTAPYTELRKRLRHDGRNRLIATINHLLCIINKPLGDILRDHALPHLPVKSLLRLRSVSAAWNRHISSPIFASTNAASNRSISGVLLHLPSGPRFSPFDPAADAIPHPALSFLPSPTTSLTSSSHGLLCLSAAGPAAYYICNPATAQFTALPNPSLACRPSADAALIFDPDVYNFSADYAVAIPFEIPSAAGLYTFETFSSITGAWWTSSELCTAEKIVAGSAVSAGGCAWWRTTMQTVVGYNPVADRVRVVPWPAAYSGDVWWQLGALAGRLCCTVVTEDNVSVHSLLPTDRWRLLASFPVVVPLNNVICDVMQPPEGIVFDQRPYPLRYQSGGMEVLLRVGERVVGVDLASRRVREMEIELAEDTPIYSTDSFVSHINTLVPVFPVGNATE